MPQKLQVYRLLKSGAVVPFVQLEFLGGATLERDSDDEGRVTLYDGLPRT